MKLTTAVVILSEVEGSSMINKINWKLLSIILSAAFLRFGGLTWAFPYNPHPDEWNMAAAITRLNWSESLNPQFFAYGQLPLYLSYFSAIIYNLIPWIKIKDINTQEAIFFLRFWSAVAGVGTVYLVYLITKKLTLTSHFSLLAALLAASTPGLIQISHFGTTESPLSFFFLWIIYVSFKIVENQKLKYFLLLAFPLGLAFGTKITALTFTIPVVLSFVLNLKNIFLKKGKILKNFFFLFGKYLLTLTLALTLTLLSSPYLLLAYEQSRGTLLYETSVATGQSRVFYTRQFIDTMPIIFQLKSIFPYALGWPIFILGSLGILLTLYNSVKNLLPKKGTILNTKYLILNTSFLLYFLSQAFLFCKWTRFNAPIFAFFPIFTAIFLSKTPSLIKNRKVLTAYYLLLTTVAIIPGIIFSTIYFLPDIHFTASEWIYKNIPSESQLLFDTGNVVDIPILSPKSLPPNPYNLIPISFDFYHLDENYELLPKLIDYIESSDYIIVPSRRIFMNHLRFPNKFLLTAKYYSLLFSGKLGFKEIKTFIPLTTKIFNDEIAEETFSVFDHPTIRIYKKTVNMTKEQYEELFK